MENEAKFYLGIQLNMISCQASPVADLEKNKKNVFFLAKNIEWSKSVMRSFHNLKKLEILW